MPYIEFRKNLPRHAMHGGIPLCFAKSGHAVAVWGELKKLRHYILN